MAKATPRIRVDLSSAEDEGGPWTVVGKNGKRRPAPLQDPPPEYRQYTLLSHQEPSDYLALKRLETAHPEACFRVTGSRTTTIRPKNEVTAFLFSRLAREEKHGIRLKETAAESRGVFQRYPLGLSLDPIIADPRVTFARRCVYDAGHGRRIPTRQVLVTFGGRLPDTMDLGSWGVYTLRKYCPEPPRCYNCQSFGHVKKHCGARELCGVCSGRHPTEDCISALKRGEQRTARCPNCGQGHHAWSKDCAERRRRLPSAPAPSHTSATKKRKRNRRRRKKTAEPLATTVEDASEPIAVPAAPEPPTAETAAPETQEPATTSSQTQTSHQPTTAEVGCQTDPPPAKTEDAAAQATPATSTAATQTAARETTTAATQTCSRETATSDSETDTSDSEEEEEDDLPPAKPSPDGPTRTLRSQTRRESQTAATATTATAKDNAPASAENPQPAFQPWPTRPPCGRRARKPSHPSRHWRYNCDPNVQACIDQTLNDPEMIKMMDEAAARKGIEVKPTLDCECNKYNQPWMKPF